MSAAAGSGSASPAGTAGRQMAPSSNLIQDRVAEFLQRYPPFSLIAPVERSDLAARVSIRYVTAGTVLFREGAQPGRRVLRGAAGVGGGLRAGTAPPARRRLRRGRHLRSAAPHRAGALPRDGGRRGRVHPLRRPGRRRAAPPAEEHPGRPLLRGRVRLGPATPAQAGRHGAGRWTVAEGGLGSGDVPQRHDRPERDEEGAHLLRDGDDPERGPRDDRARLRLDRHRGRRERPGRDNHGPRPQEQGRDRPSRRPRARFRDHEPAGEDRPGGHHAGRGDDRDDPEEGPPPLRNGGRDRPQRGDRAHLGPRPPARPGLQPGHHDQGGAQDGVRRSSWSPSGRRPRSSWRGTSSRTSAPSTSPGRSRRSPTRSCSASSSCTSRPRGSRPGTSRGWLSGATDARSSSCARTRTTRSSTRRAGRRGTDLVPRRGRLRVGWARGLRFRPRRGRRLGLEPGVVPEPRRVEGDASPLGRTTGRARHPPGDRLPRLPAQRGQPGARAGADAVTSTKRSPARRCSSPSWSRTRFPRRRR